MTNIDVTSAAGAAIQHQAKGENMTEGQTPSDLLAMVSGLQRMVEIQAEVQKHQIDANSSNEHERISLERERTTLQADHAGRTQKQAFLLQMCTVLIVAGVVAGGFFTNNIGVVTHALTAVLGMVAGLGLARRK